MTEQPKTTTLERTSTGAEAVPQDGSGKGKVAHFVGKESLAKAMLTGEPVTALCGKLWTPKSSPQGLPVCPLCKEIWESMELGDSPLQL